MVLGQLLTYRMDVPQEGRITFSPRNKNANVELRIAVMPTRHGLRAALRLPTDQGSPRTLEALGLAQPVLQMLRLFAASDAGMLLVTGPAGSGKTTTLYALLQHIVTTHPGLSVVALEDPVERDLPGVTQIEVSAFGELTYEVALRSMLRQDPQVLMIGEIRDAATATLAVQAALSGHRLISTMHASTPGGAIARLLEMGIEPYQISSALCGVISQRLLRRTATARDGSTQYQGRFALAQALTLQGPVRQAVLTRADVQTLDAAAATQSSHFSNLRQAALEAVARGQTDLAEVNRVLGADTTL